MINPLISVIVATYFPQKEKLIATLRSIVLQKDCVFEVIVTDDGSDNFFENDIRMFFEKSGISNYQILSHKENQGTVKNLLDAANVAHGKYIKTISPGDYLYDQYTLRDVCEFMDHHNALVAFGDMAVFTYENNNLKVKKIYLPGDDRIYNAKKEFYNYKKILKHQLIYSDLICGASDLYEKSTFCKAMEEIKDIVIYAEDSAYQLLTVQGIRIYKIPRKIVWYEHGTGISTCLSSPLFSRIDKDYYRFYHMLKEKYPETPYLNRNSRFWERRLNSSFLKNQFFRFMSIDKILFSIFRRLYIKTRPNNYDKTFFLECIKKDSL